MIRFYEFSVLITQHHEVYSELVGQFVAGSLLRPSFPCEANLLQGGRAQVECK